MNWLDTRCEPGFWQPHYDPLTHLSELPGNKQFNFFGGNILCIAQKLKRNVRFWISELRCPAKYTQHSQNCWLFNGWYLPTFQLFFLQWVNKHHQQGRPQHRRPNTKNRTKAHVFPHQNGKRGEGSFKSLPPKPRRKTFFRFWGQTEWPVLKKTVGKQTRDTF